MSIYDEDFDDENYFELRKSDGVFDQFCCDAYLRGRRDGYQKSYLSVYKLSETYPVVVRVIRETLKEWLFDLDLDYIDKLLPEDCILAYSMFLQGKYFEDIKNTINLVHSLESNDKLLDDCFYNLS